MQAGAAVILVLALASHVTEVRTNDIACSGLPAVPACTMMLAILWLGVLQVGFVGLSITIVVTALNGLTEEHEVQSLYRYCLHSINECNHVWM